MVPRQLTLLAVALATVLLAMGGTAAAQFAGEEFQVNSYTTGYQYKPSVASSGTGSFVVVWQSYPQLGQGAGSDIFGQRFASDGSRTGGEFQVNSYTYGYQYYPDVAAAEDGSFAVVWTEGGLGGDGDGSGISGQRFDGNGLPVGSEFRVNAESAGDQTAARVAVDMSGNMTVVWWTKPSGAAPNPDGDSSGIFARRFDAIGTPLGSEFQVNELTTGGQSFPDAKYDSEGNLVVVWQTTDDVEADIVVRRFSSDGSPLGGDFVITNPLSDEFPRVGVAKNGDFIVVWHNPALGFDGLDGSSQGVFAARFNADGTTAGPVFQVNTYTTEAQAYPSVASGEGGGAVIVWDSYKQASQFSDIFAQRYDRSGNPFESEFKVDTFDEHAQSVPKIAWLGGDRFAVVWQSLNEDGDSQGVFGRIVVAGFPTAACGDADSNDRITASDALTALRTAVGTGACQECVCDVNGQSGITASDALIILRVAVGQPLEFACPACA